MDFSNFIKNYYRYSITQLKGFTNYYGTIVNVNRELDIPKNFMHREETQSMFLPTISVNIDAPTNYFVDFMDHYVKMMPDLGFVFADKNRIKQLYDNAVAMNVLQDDEKALSYIEFVIGIGVKALEQQGLLER